MQSLKNDGKWGNNDVDTTLGRCRVGNNVKTRSSDNRAARFPTKNYKHANFREHVQTSLSIKVVQKFCILIEYGALKQVLRIVV